MGVSFVYFAECFVLFGRRKNRQRKLWNTRRNNRKEKEGKETSESAGEKFLTNTPRLFTSSPLLLNTVEKSTVQNCDPDSMALQKK